MYGSKRSPQSDRPSIKYKWNRVEDAASALDDFNLKEHGSKHTEERKHTGLDAEHERGPEILSTTELISAVGHIWDLVNPPVSEPEDHNCTVSNVVAKDVHAEALKDEGCCCYGYSSVDVSADSNITTWVQPKLEFLSVTQKISMFAPCSKSFSLSSFSQFLKGRMKHSYVPWKGKEVASLGVPHDVDGLHGWMKEVIPSEHLYPVSVTKTVKDKKAAKTSCSGSSIIHTEGCIPKDGTHVRDDFMLGGADTSGLFKPKDASLGDNVKVAVATQSISSLCSDYFLGALHDNNVVGSVSVAPSLNMDGHIDMLASHKSSCGTVHHNSDDDERDKNPRKHHHKYVAEDKDSTYTCSSACERPRYGLAKQQHAYAGAFAGIFVSLCLHPVDTIKTVTQSNHMEQKSLCDIGRSLVTERGVSGFYRGIASNIASSAPISAIYTFTYESVKGSLLPLFPKEYHSLAHCIAGGSASIATSFVFTPSERIKQQMQIGSRYHNCWSALIGIISNGGLPSLYTGWGAVLCRNVPHSIIKFYTYESLKQLMLTSHNSNRQPNTIQTLICGGLAGSTAALFTTPFDVVKTRLQIQIPGSLSQYDSVFHAIKEIGKNEGLKGLYRGLIPRLIMYVSQGALFFASYEFFKRFFSLEVPQFGAQRILCKQSMEDDST